MNHGWVTSAFASSRTSTTSFLPLFDSLLPVTPPSSLASETLHNSLWIDHYRPFSTDQLVIHNGKVKQLTLWLTTTYKTKPILVINGPSGSGKFACLQVLAKDLALSLLTWVNPVFAGNQSSDSPSVLQSFHDFLARGSLYALPTDILVIRDFPIFSHHGLQATRAMLASMLASRKTLRRIVFIFTLFTPPQDLNTASNIDIPAAHDLLPPSCSPFVYTITFNPVAPTLLSKALHRICHAERLPVPRSLSSIVESCHGNMTAAITALQFNNLIDPTRRNKDSYQCTNDQSRCIFRLIGRILLSPRTPTKPHCLPPPLASHLESKWTRDPLEFDMPHILTNMPVSADAFAMYLHANLPTHVQTLSAWTWIACMFAQTDRRHPVPLTCAYVASLGHDMPVDPWVDLDVVGADTGEWDDFDDIMNTVSSSQASCSPPSDSLAVSKHPLSSPKFASLKASDHWAVRRAASARAAALARIGLRPTEAPFTPVLSSALTQNVKKRSRLGSSGNPGLDDELDLLAVLDAQIPANLPPRWYLLAARRAGVPARIAPGVLRAVDCANENDDMETEKIEDYDSV